MPSSRSCGTQVVPLMEAAGASFVLCDVGARPRRRRRRAAPSGRVADFVAWNGIRRDLMFDPRYHPYSGRARTAPARRDPALLPRRAAPSRGPRPTTTVRRSGGGRCSRSHPTPRPRHATGSWRAMRDCDRFIPGITRCAVGTNTARPPDRAGVGDHVPVGGCLRRHLHDAPVPRRRCSTASSCPTAPSASPPRTTFGAGLIGYTGRP